VGLRALDSQSFGFSTDCFVCNPSNPQGLRIPFFLDEEAGRVTAEFTLGPGHSGAPRFVHGGLVLTVLDEAMAWAVVAIAERFGVVRTSSAGFRRPVHVDQRHRVEGMVEEQDERSISTYAQVLDPNGRRCAQAKAKFAILSEETARAAIGDDLAGNDRYLREGKA
jgi:acyl-coenzyme A thioesterase PaaI-like protein